MNSRFANSFAFYREQLLRRNSSAARRQKIRRIRDEIERGVYESEKKLSVAIDRLIQDVLRRNR